MASGDSSTTWCVHDGVVEKLIKTLSLATQHGAHPEVMKSLEKTVKLARLKDDFVTSMCTKNSQGCAHLATEGLDHDWDKVNAQGKSPANLLAKMLSGSLTGQFLKSFISVQKPKRAMEVGMFTAFGALSMAEAMPADGQVVTIDFCQYLEDLVRPLLDQYPHGKKVKIRIGDACEVMRQYANSGQKFDVIFIDAAKAQYPEYVEICFREDLLAPNGTVFVDNAFIGADAYDSEIGETKAKIFAAYLARQDDLHKVLIPMRDGVYMLRRLSEVEGQDAN